MSTETGENAELQTEDLENLEDMEGLSEEGSEEDQSGLESEDTPTDDEPGEEIDLGNLDVDELQSGSRPEESEDETKKHNRNAAKQRVTLKKQQEELERLKSSPQVSPGEDDPMPKRTDFFNKEALYDKYDGDTVLAQAAYEDAKDDWQIRQSKGQSDAISKAEADIELSERLVKVQDDFEAESEKYRGKVANFDANIEAAERSLLAQAPDGKVIDGALAIKNHYGEDAPLMLAAIGANPKLADKIKNAKSQPEFFDTLAMLRMSVKKKVPSGKKLSKADPEEPLRGDDKSGVDVLQKRMDEAADAGDFDTYTALKAQLEAKQES